MGDLGGMSSPPPRGPDVVWTLHAEHPRIGDVTFMDYVPEGATVDLYDDPHDEEGYQGTGVVYRDEQGKWLVRDLTEAERMERVDRLLAQARKRHLPTAERLRDPAADAGGPS